MMVTSSLMSATDQQQLKHIATAQVTTSRGTPAQVVAANAINVNEKKNVPIAAGRIVSGMSNQVN